MRAMAAATLVAVRPLLASACWSWWQPNQAARCGPVERPGLSLPHPRLQERSFVLAPLAAIDPGLRPPGPTAEQAPPVAERLQALLPQLDEPAPERLGGRGGWPE